MLTPNAKLRKAVNESSGPVGEKLQLLQQAPRKMGLEDGDQEEAEPRSRVSLLAARCWALLLVLIYECLPLLCPNRNRPMRILAFIHDPPDVEKILRHIGEPTRPPKVKGLRERVGGLCPRMGADTP